jgi:hypothetical protein
MPLVSRNSTAEPLGDPAGLASALHQQPSPDRDAARSAQRDRRSERQLAEGHPSAESDRGAIEHLQEGQHIPQAGEDLESDRDQQPVDSHVCHGFGHSVQSRHSKQQPHDERSQDRQRDKASPQAAARLGRGAQLHRDRFRAIVRRFRPVTGGGHG